MRLNYMGKCARVSPQAALWVTAILFLVAMPAARTFEPVVEKQVNAIKNGSKWLLSAQNKDGSWGMDWKTRTDVSCTAVAGLSLLAAGNTERNGPSPKAISAIRKSIDYLLRRARRTHRRAGIADGESSQIQNYVGQRAHTFFTVLYLSQVYGMTTLNLPPETNQQIKAAVTKFSETISYSQESDGSWYKDTYSNLQGTALAWMALRSTSSCALPVKGATVNKTIDFIEKQYNPSTKFYDGTRINGGNRIQLIYATASAIRIMQGMGKGREKSTKDAVENLVTKITKGGWGSSFLTNTGEDYPAAFMMTHAMVHEGGKLWEDWFTFIRNKLCKIQNNDGSWTSTSCLVGRTFVTSCSLLCLETPFRLLPVQDL